jgi:Family of unknown function (DUF6624)
VYGLLIALDVLTSSRNSSGGVALNEALRAELIAMDDHDQAVRANLAADGSLFLGYHPRMAAVHDSNAARLREIISEYGWPTTALVGLDGTKAAHRIAQHSINHPDLCASAAS